MMNWCRIRTPALCGLLSASVAGAAGPPVDWPREQHFDVPTAGLVKLSLPIETLDSARPALEDLRLYDESWNELPYVVDRPRPTPKIIQNAKSFEAALNSTTTVLTLETGLAQPLDGVTLETQTHNFVKAVQIESSADGQQWQTLAQGQPIFAQPGLSQLHLPVPTGVWPWLRLTVDDQRAAPVPFTGARVHAAAAEAVRTEKLALRISGRDESPGESRFTVNLGAANLDLAAIQIETTEPLFTRGIKLAVPRISEDGIREETLTQGVIYRIAVDGQPASSNLVVRVENRIPSREILLVIRNEDSPPLAISGVSAEQRPVYLVFLARSGGTYHLLTGNTRCGAPRYDLAGLGGDFKTVAVAPVKLSPLSDNPTFRAPEVLPGVPQTGTGLDVSAWSFRKPIQVTRAGGEQSELDLDVLTHAQPSFDDLRLVRAGKQMPYLLERTSITRSLTPVVDLTYDAKNPHLERWIIKAPRAALPFSRLSCRSPTALFQRELSLYEEPVDERGEKYRQPLGAGSWIQTPERASKELLLTFDRPPQGDTFILKTDNGDNPPIALEKFALAYPVTRIQFKAEPRDELFLYYGNARASTPRYDLSLVASQLRLAEKSPATLGAEERLRKASWREGQVPGKGGVLFWGVLGVVVLVLLLIISRLVPKPPPAGAK